MGNSLDGKSIRVLIVDDHPALAFGAQLALRSVKMIDTIEIANDSTMALQLMEKLHPNVVVLDINLPEIQGVELAREIKARYGSWIIIYTGDEDWATHLQDLMNIPISGIVLKRHSITFLTSAVQGVLDGYAAIPLDIFASLRCGDTDVNRNIALRKRDFQLLQLLDEGCTNQEISGRMFLSTKTVEHYLTQLYKKLGVSSRSDAVAKFNEEYHS